LRLSSWPTCDLGSWRWFLIALVSFLPLHVSAVVLDEWFVLPPKPIGDGPDYEAIGFGISKGYGWSTSYSDPEWRSVYIDTQNAKSGLDYSDQLARRGPVVADTNRPPLLPFCIAVVYQISPRGPIAFGMIRVALAFCLSIGCAIAVAWAVAIARGMDNEAGPQLPPVSVGLSLIAIVYSERNFRNYTTDFSTEPLAFLLTQVFLLIVWYGSQKGCWRWAAFGGALFAFMVLCRGVFVLWVPLATLWLWHAYRVSKPNEVVNRLEPRRWVCVFLIVFGLLSSIGWVRNCCVLGSFHPLGTKGVATLMGGYCDESFQSGGEWQFAPEREMRRGLESKIDIETATPLDFQNIELEINKQARLQIKKIQLLPELMFKRVATEWNPYSGKALLLKLLALAGVVWLFCNNRVALIWLAGPLLINTIVVALTYSVGGRFLVPTYGLIYILAAFGIGGILNALVFQGFSSVRV
jgi:hypothetical protein